MRREERRGHGDRPADFTAGRQHAAAKAHRIPGEVGELTVSVWGRCQPRTWPAATLKGSLQDGAARPAEPATSGDLSPLKRGWEAARVPLREGNEHCFPSQGRSEEGRGFPSTPEAPSACSPRPERCPAWGRPRLRVGDSETLARWATGRRAAREEGWADSRPQDCSGGTAGVATDG